MARLYQSLLLALTMTRDVLEKIGCELGTGAMAESSNPGRHFR